MRNSQDSFETRKGSFISAFSICITVPLGNFSLIRCHKFHSDNLKKTFLILDCVCAKKVSDISMNKIFKLSS